ncbi:DUF899 domain-containing protein [Maritalea sp.]|uniref:DUF899 domain-containing protein n=1 Tax=Maritalea sp. TaxID=2003361 RepID=UPI003EF6C6BF
MKPNTIVDRATWENERRDLLAQEKEFTQLKDELSAKRRNMPWVKIDQDYRFETERGEESLLDLFGDKQQLLIYHFMYGPDWKQGCKSCSFWADNFNGNDAHFGARDVSFKVISLAALSVFMPFKKRMGWTFDWVSSAPSSFNFDFHVSFKPDQKDKQYNFKPFESNADEMPGISVFARDGDDVYHTYSAHSRGLDLMNGVYNFLDLTPKGRDEDELVYGMEWLKHKDSY